MLAIPALLIGMMALIPAIALTSTILRSPVLAQGADAQPSTLAKLGNGDYQLCSQVDPQDGRDGAGVCLNIAKRGDRVDGYYGYPHSGNFVCIRGQIDQHRVVGRGLVISWPSHPWPPIQPSQYQWRLDQHLTLKNGYLVRSVREAMGRVDWIEFDEVILDITGFYQYEAVKMRPPSQLCEWGNP